MIWKVKLSNNEEFSEDTIETAIANPQRLTPWLLLESHFTSNNLTVKELIIWDDNTNIRLYSPGKISSQTPDYIDFRRKYVSEGMSSNIPSEIAGFIIKKDGVSFGVWYKSLTREIFTTIESL